MHAYARFPRATAVLMMLTLSFLPPPVPRRPDRLQPLTDPFEQ